MGKALYRKHRPKKLSEVVGQEHITDTLGRALKNQTVSHAYLLTGPRGTGKTSVARILAYEVNSLPYDEEGTHMDIIEIDAASNRRIDEIRELKERVNIAPTSAKYKVYIIDEVHMLTKEAFNALLKTLEEPPEHAIFILATTESHKVPETIVSRTQRFTFKPVETNKVVNHLKSIAKAEKIVIEDGALELVAKFGEGSFRDSISLLDQVRYTSNKITLQDIQNAVGQAPEDILNNVLRNVESHNLQQIAKSLTELRTQGIQSTQIAKQLSAKIRQRLISDSSVIVTLSEVELLSDLLNISATTEPDIALEVALFKTALDKNIDPILQTMSKTQSKADISTKPKKGLSSEKKAEKESIVHDLAVSKHKELSELDETSWQEVLSAIKSKYNTLYGIARMATPRFEKDKLTLVLNFAFHLKRLEDPKNKGYIQELIAQTTGQNVSIEFLLDKHVIKQNSQQLEEEASKELNLETISNIFGSAEIVE